MCVHHRHCSHSRPSSTRRPLRASCKEASDKFLSHCALLVSQRITLIWAGKEEGNERIRGWQNGGKSYESVCEMCSWWATVFLGVVPGERDCVLKVSKNALQSSDRVAILELLLLLQPLSPTLSAALSCTECHLTCRTLSACRVLSSGRSKKLEGASGVYLRRAINNEGNLETCSLRELTL